MNTIEKTGVDRRVERKIRDASEIDGPPADGAAGAVGKECRWSLAPSPETVDAIRREGTGGDAPRRSRCHERPQSHEPPTPPNATNTSAPTSRDSLLNQQFGAERRCLKQSHHEREHLV
jgi:hypothetical protein